MRAKVRRMKASSGAGATRKLDCRGGRGERITRPALSGGLGPDAVDHWAGPRHVIRARTDPPNAAAGWAVRAGRRAGCRDRAAAGLGPGAGVLGPGSLRDGPA